MSASCGFPLSRIDDTYGDEDSLFHSRIQRSMTRKDWNNWLKSTDACSREKRAKIRETMIS